MGKIYDLARQRLLRVAYGVAVEKLGEGVGVEPARLNLRRDDAGEEARVGERGRQPGGTLRLADLAGK